MADSRPTGVLQTIKVSICGEPFTLKSDKTNAFIHSVTAYLDAKVAEAGTGSVNMDRFKLLAIAALEVTAELLAAKEELNGMKNTDANLEQRVRHLNADLSRVLKALP